MYSPIDDNVTECTNIFDHPVFFKYFSKPNEKQTEKSKQKKEAKKK